MCRKEHVWKWIFFLKECVWKCVAIVCLCLPFFSMYCLVTCARIYLVLIWCNGKVVPWWPVGDRFKSGNNIFAYARVRLRTMTLLHTFTYQGAFWHYDIFFSQIESLDCWCWLGSMKLCPSCAGKFLNTIEIGFMLNWSMCKEMNLKGIMK